MRWTIPGGSRAWLSMWRDRAWAIHCHCPSLLLMLSVLVGLPVPLRAADNRPLFGLRDDIALVRFDQVMVSPGARFALVHTEQASFADGRMHDRLLVYEMRAIRRAVDAHQSLRPIVPRWEIDEATRDTGGNLERISQLRWLNNGTAFAFLRLTGPYCHRLLVADVARRQIVRLTPGTHDVLGFDIRDRSHYVYTVASPAAAAQLAREAEARSRVGTGRSLTDLAFPEAEAHFIQRGELWAAEGGPARPILDSRTGKPIALFSDGNDSLTLSPDGREVAALMAVSSVSEDWVRRYPPPFPASAYGLQAHSQDLNAPYDSWSYVSSWVRIALSSGTVIPLTLAPAAERAGWWEVYATRARWSSDGATILLPGTFSRFLPDSVDRPCIVAENIGTRASTCVRPLKRQLAGGVEPGWQSIDALDFIRGRDDEVVLRHEGLGAPDKTEATVYRRSGSGLWSPDRKTQDPDAGDRITLKVEENFDCPPRLIAVDTGTGRSRTLLDPNARLDGIRRGDAELYHWRDGTGRAWQGILYKPVGFVPGKRYPLVLQNHGFSLSRFLPSGGFPTAFAAEELASAGILVLQIRDCAGRSTPVEGLCNVAGYESAVDKLSRDGLADPARVGIIGFSRTVFYVLDALSAGSIKFRAASITDGITLGYGDYLLGVGMPPVFDDELVQMIGAPPFGDGLAHWTKSSPVFHLDQVTTPLRIVATRGPGIVEMWEPYALLEAMHKPVDLIVLNTRQHVLVDPRMRLIAQGGTIDWFRFWLENYEDPDPSKQTQYGRWRRMRDRIAAK